MIERDVHLAYNLAPGWLAPYVEALLQGRALARACRACRHVSYPPLHGCGCSKPEPHWVQLSGRAEILYRSDGTDGSFALVRFAGADTMAVVRLAELPQGELLGALGAPPDQRPALILGPIDHVDQGFSR